MGNLCLRNESINPGSVLDRVISQASNDDDCLLYKLANYKKVGELIDAYTIGGAMEVEKLIKEQFGILMYKEGKGQTISRTEYLRWKFRNTKHVVIPVEASSRTDPLGRWEDHEACWQMQYRGSLGETLLHVLIICDTRIHTRLARILIKCYPKLAVDVVEGEEYLGASALHLAIAYANNDLVHILVESGCPIEQRATGSFFLPRDQQRVRPSKTTDYEGLAYLGEYPLAWAACVNNESVYNLLLDCGADPDKQDSFGNMILHMVVITDQLGMYGYALRHPKTIASNDIINNQGLTPLTLACRLGRASVFREMLELSAREFWRYSNITCSAYPLNALDTIHPDGRTNWNSALFMILAGSKEDHLNMLDGGIIQRLLEEKWKTFAQMQFVKRISIAFIHLLAMSVAVYLRPKDRNQPLHKYSDVKDIIRLGFELGTIGGCISYLAVQQGGEIKNQGLWTFLKQLPHSPPKLVFVIANFLILSCIPFRISGDVKTEEGLLTLTMVFSWFFMMFFAGAIKLTGPFVTMVYSMITGDMLTFGVIYTIFLLGFSQSFYYLYKSHPQVNATLFVEYETTWMALYQMTLGTYDYSQLSGTAYPNTAKTVFIIFMIMVPILLLNMLIAMMGNTYSQVIERSEKEWVKQWAKIVVALERAVSQEDASQHIQDYSIKLGGTDPSNEVRGVMVIKCKSKTRATQRKGAVSNWKRVGKVTITALKKRKMTGEEMRQLMWGHRNSVCTPQNITPRTSMGIDPTLQIPGAGTAGLDAALSQMTFATDLNSNGAALGSPNLFGCFDDTVNLQPGITGVGGVGGVGVGGVCGVGVAGVGGVGVAGVGGVGISGVGGVGVGVAGVSDGKLQTGIVPIDGSSPRHTGTPPGLQSPPRVSVSVVTTATATVTTTSRPATAMQIPQTQQQQLALPTVTNLDASGVPLNASEAIRSASASPEKSPNSALKVKRRNAKLGIRPRIIIFSDKKDLIRVSLDSNESDSDICEIIRHRPSKYQVGKSSKRNLAGGSAANLSSSAESLSGDMDDLIVDSKLSRRKGKRESSQEESESYVNFAFEPEEFADKVIPRAKPRLSRKDKSPPIKTKKSVSIEKEKEKEPEVVAEKEINTPIPETTEEKPEPEKPEKKRKERPKSAKPQTRKSRNASSSATRVSSSEPPIEETPEGNEDEGEESSNSDEKHMEKEKKRMEQEKRQKVANSRSKSAKNGTNKVKPKSKDRKKSKEENKDAEKKDEQEQDIPEKGSQEEDETDGNGNPRPLTAVDRWSTQDVFNMNKLVAWDRPEDDI